MAADLFLLNILENLDLNPETGSLLGLRVAAGSDDTLPFCKHQDIVSPEARLVSAAPSDFIT